jgi:hypothetical protein
MLDGVRKHQVGLELFFMSVFLIAFSEVELVALLTHDRYCWQPYK